MTRGHPPSAAIAEARRSAASRGCFILGVNTRSFILPFDFVIADHGRISIVLVRRLRYAGYEPADIEISCRNEIEALRALTMLPEISRQLHVRGPDRHWHRYVVMQETIEKIREGGTVQGRRKAWRSEPTCLPAGQQTLEAAIL